MSLFELKRILRARFDFLHLPFLFLFIPDWTHSILYYRAYFDFFQFLFSNLSPCHLFSLLLFHCIVSAFVLFINIYITYFSFKKWKATRRAYVLLLSTRKPRAIPTLISWNSSTTGRPYSPQNIDYRVQTTDYRPVKRTALYVIVRLNLYSLLHSLLPSLLINSPFDSNTTSFFTTFCLGKVRD